MAGAKTLTATYNGTAWTATTRIGAWLGGNLTINGNDGARSLSISAVGISGPGPYTPAAGNPDSALAMWLDGVGNHSSLGTGGSGTITLTRSHTITCTGSTTASGTGRRPCTWPTGKGSGWAATTILSRPIELYDLSTDAFESTDVAAAHPDRVARIREIMESRTESRVERWNFAKRSARPPHQA